MGECSAFSTAYKFFLLNKIMTVFLSFISISVDSLCEEKCSYK